MDSRYQGLHGPAEEPPHHHSELGIGSLISECCRGLIRAVRAQGEKKESKDDKESKSACELCFKIFITFPKVLEPSFVCSQW